jgi:predicted nucleic acid-binding protein
LNQVVVDASVAVKWFIPEAGCEDAAALLDASVRLLAPDLLFAEVGNVLWKKVTRAEITVAEARAALKLLKAVPFDVVSSSVLTDAALEIACAYKRSVYDALYVALAVARDATLVTADRRLVQALAASPFSRSVRGLGI